MDRAIQHTKYLIAGSSHAALEAINAIRMHDAEGSVTVVTRDPHLPYSPTVLPYVVSGKSAPERVFLRDEDFFARNKVAYRRGAGLTVLDAGTNVAHDGARRASSTPSRHTRSASSRRPARANATPR